jgi:hypothetical protein
VRADDARERVAVDDRKARDADRRGYWLIVAMSRAGNGSPGCR